MERFATDRLIAERLREDHLADLVALHLDPDVSRYIGGVRAPEATKAYLATSIAHWDQHGFGLWALRTPAGEFTGRAGIRRTVVDDVPEFEILYALMRDFWGRGLASEIASAPDRNGTVATPAAIPCRLRRRRQRCFPSRS
jgi:RimJ/RimL family protein N-acetyltransferase